MKHRHAFARLYYHVVFTTHRRAPLINSAELEQFLARLFNAKAGQMDVYLLACGAWVDHVHMIASTRPALAPEKLVHDLKGYAAWVWNREQALAHGQLNWSDGYWIETVSPNDLPALRDYVNQQREKHQRQEINTSWEPPPT